MCGGAARLLWRATMPLARRPWDARDIFKVCFDPVCRRADGRPRLRSERRKEVGSRFELAQRDKPIFVANTYTLGGFQFVQLPLDFHPDRTDDKTQRERGDFQVWGPAYLLHEARCLEGS